MNKMKVQRSLAVLLALTLLIVAGCGGGGSKKNEKSTVTETSASKETAKQDTKSSEPIVIGAVVSLSGAVADLGKQDKWAIDVAVKQVNDAGGVLGRPLKVVYYDEFKEPAEVLAQGEQDGVWAWVGFDNSGNALKYFPEIMKKKQILMVSGAGSPAITDAVAKDPVMNKYLFRNGNHALDWARTANVYLRDIQKAKSYFYLAQDNPFGKALEGILATVAKEDGITSVGSHFFERGSADFTEAMAKINQAKPDVIVGYVGPSATAWGKLYHDQQIAIPFFDIAASSFELENKVKAELGEKANHLSLTLFAWDVPITSKTQPFYAAYKQVSGGEPPGGLFDVRAGDAVSILAEAIDRAGALDADKVVEVLETSSFSMVAGIYEFDSSHQAKWGPRHLSGLIGQWQNGKLEIIWPSQNQTAQYAPAPWWQNQVAGN